MPRNIALFTCSFIIVLVTACVPIAQDASSASFTYTNDPNWASGTAEVNVYSLEQNRYRDVHPGELVSIFVREDFLTDKQVKNDNYTNKNSIGVLKNIQTRKFTTGVYDYSVFHSVFTSVERSKYPKSLKLSSSSQEWCGTTYLQLNSQANGYKVMSHSYFENEADRELRIPNGILEDELFNVIRMNPDALPIGEFDIIPAAFYLQLMHADLKSYPAKASLSDYIGNNYTGERLKVYSVNMPTLNRKLSIVFEGVAPFKIIGWLDQYPSISDKEIRTTVVKLKSQESLKYWQMNGKADVAVRERLRMSQSTVR